MSRILSALAARDLSVRFTCSATGLDLVAVAPTSAQRIEATRAAQKAADGLDGMASMLAMQRAMELALVASCILDDGRSLGHETAAQLPEPVVSEYGLQVQAAIDRFDPAAETLTDAEIEELEQAVKKKGLRERLTDCDIATLRAYIMHMAAVLSNSETWKSSPGSTEESRR